MRIRTPVTATVMACAVFAEVALFAPPAHALTYSFSASGEKALTSLGNQVDTYGFSPWDQLSVPTNSGFFTPGTPFTLNVLSFTVGINATIPYVTTPYDITETVTFGGGLTPGLLTIPFNITIAYQDEIQAISSNFGPFAGGWTLAVSAPDTGLVSTGQTLNYDLTALVKESQVNSLLDIAPTPLPAALPLFAGGLGIMGLIAKRKKRNAAPSPNPTSLL